MHYKEYLHGFETIRGRFNAYGSEAELKLGDITGWEVNILMLRGILDIIMEDVIVIRNADSEVLGGRDGENHMECRCC